MSAAYVDVLRALYGLPELDFEALRKGLPDVGDGLQAKLQQLHDHPSEARAEILLHHLEGARRHVLRFAEAIREEVADGDA